MTASEAEDAAAVALVRELLELEQEPGTPLLEVRLGPFTTYALITTVQLACRHPAMRAGPLREHIERAARQIQAGLHPALAALLERGWDPDQDRS